MLRPEVERWREIANEKLDVVLASEPELNVSWGYTRNTLIDYILGIGQKESGGNPFALGDRKKETIDPGITWDKWTYNLAVQYLDRFNSVGFGQMNWGAGTPQDLGVQNKIDLLDIGTNLEAVIRLFLRLMKRYNGNVAEALSAYNAGHSIQANIANYVNVIFSYVQDVLKEKKITSGSSSSESPDTIS